MWFEIPFCTRRSSGAKKVYIAHLGLELCGQNYISDHDEHWGRPCLHPSSFADQSLFCTVNSRLKGMKRMKHLIEWNIKFNSRDMSSNDLSDNKSVTDNNTICCILLQLFASLARPFVTPMSLL